MITCTPLAIYRQRLLNAARSVVEFDHENDEIGPGEIRMTGYVKPCGSPACVLGHYAMRSDLQSDFYISGGYLHSCATRAEIGYDWTQVIFHFGISKGEANRLFNEHGCGAARKAEDVYQYIRRFVDVKYPQWSLYC